MKYNLITILGPTATGKTTLAAHLAFKLGTCVISADSRQVYKRMNIGTGKDYDDYIVNNTIVPYHLIDIVEPGYKYNVYEYQRDFLKVFREYANESRIPVLCGGTGLYIEAVLKGYKLIQVPVNENLRKELEDKTLEELAAILSSYKKLHNKTDIGTKKHAIRAIEIEKYYSSHPEINIEYPEINSIIIGVLFDRETRRRRIAERLKARMESGMIDEVKQLLDSGLSKEDLIYYGLEYKFITQYLTGELQYKDMYSKLETAIMQFAKRQMTWFRGMERKGFKIHWVDGEMNLVQKVITILNFLQKQKK